MPIRAVMFDLDDTLLDWSERRMGWFDDPEGHAKHFAQAARHFKPQIAEEKIKALLDSFRKEMIDMLSGDIDDAPHLGRMLSKHLHKLEITDEPVSASEVLDVYGWDHTPGVKVFPDVPEVLPQLREKGFKLGLITNGFQPMAMRDREMAHYGILDYLPECRFSSADLGILKPDKRIFLKALDCLKVKPEEAVYVGDSIYNDVMGAKNAGIKGVWRPRKAGAQSSAVWVKPDGVITTLHDLLPLLEKWNKEG